MGAGRAGADGNSNEDENLQKNCVQGTTRKKPQALAVFIWRFLLPCFLGTSEWRGGDGWQECHKGGGNCCREWEEREELLLRCTSCYCSVGVVDPSLNLYPFSGPVEKQSLLFASV